MQDTWAVRATAQATEYFTKLANMLDEDHDGTITQAEFEIGLKRHAVKTLDPSAFPTFHYGDAQSGVPSGRLQRFQAAANNCIVEACKGIMQQTMPPRSQRKGDREEQWLVEMAMAATNFRILSATHGNEGVDLC